MLRLPESASLRRLLRPELFFSLLAVLLTYLSYRLLPLLRPSAATVFPDATAIFRELRENVTYYATHSALTALAAILGLIVGSLLGTVAGILAGISRNARGFLVPLATWLKATPIIALSPILSLLLFGNALLTSAASAAAICFYPIFMNVRDGLQQRQSPEVEYLVSLRARPSEILLLAKLPKATAFAIAGLKTASTLAVVGATAGEFLGGKAGIGYIVLDAQRASNYSKLCLAMILSGLLGVLFLAIASFLGRWGLVQASMSLPDEEN